MKAAFSAASLRQRGFAFVHAPEVAEACEAAVAAFSRRSAFRYPAGRFDSKVDHAYRVAFNHMHALAAACLHEAGGSSFPPASSSPPPFVGERSELGEPFAGAAAAPYSASFASIFNFDYGFLNEHSDRGLLTAVFGRPQVADGVRVRLRCRQLDSGLWMDLGEAPPGSLVVMAGEQLEHASGGRFKAVAHSCRVDPDGARLDTRLLSDPSAGPNGNRQSMALVLAHAD